MKDDPFDTWWDDEKGSSELELDVDANELDVPEYNNEYDE
jgi:hypothetical protein